MRDGALRTPPQPRSRRGRRGCPAAVLLLAVLPGLVHPPAARAVIITVADTGSANAISLRVGSAVGTDTVNFNVAGNNVGLTPTAVAGTPAIDVWVTPVRAVVNNTTARPVTLSVDSSAGLSCQSSTCGTTVIPFTKIRWVASNNSNAASGDIQSTSAPFTGGTSQQIATFNANANVCILLLSGLPCLFGTIGTSWTYQSRNLSATRLQFSYVNDVVYPAGNYRGTVRFTASME